MDEINDKISLGNDNDETFFVSLTCLSCGKTLIKLMIVANIPIYLESIIVL